MSLPVSESQHEGLNILAVPELKVNQSDIEYAYIFPWQCQERTSPSVTGKVAEKEPYNKLLTSLLGNTEATISHLMEKSTVHQLSREARTQKKMRKR